MTEKEACGIQKTLRELGPEPDIAIPKGRLGLQIEGTVYEKWIAQCRTGSFPIGEGYEAADLYCNAILKVAAGELEPIEVCGPPRCAESGTPIWAYNEAELRDLAEDNRSEVRSPAAHDLQLCGARPGVAGGREAHPRIEQDSARRRMDEPHWRL